MSTAADAADDVRRAAEDRAQHARLIAQLAVAEDLAGARGEELAARRSELQVEESDVRRLEGLSPSRLWATLRGDIDDRAARERAERDAAARALAGAESRHAEARRAADGLRAAGEALGDTEGSYATALAALERSLQGAGAAESVELAEIATLIGAAADERREIAEAIAAVEAAATALHDARGRLDSAGGWSTYDTFFGGGFVADLVKHGHLDEATAAFGRVNRALERVRIELSDIGAAPPVGVVVSESLAVFDVLFDNIVSDWMVRDRIAAAREEVVVLQVRLSELLRALAERDAATAQRLAELARRREELLLAAT